MMQTQKHQWLYYKLYVGQHFKKLDFLIKEVTKDLLAHEGVLKWFFIRYFDEGGIHLRLRIKTEKEVAEKLDLTFYRIFHEVCNRLVEEPESIFTPLVSVPENEGIHSNFNGLVVTKRELYEPEFDIYGEKIEAAEELFCQSSQIALQILSLEDEHNELSRKDIAPRLMFEVIQAFKPSDGASAFLDAYSNYWLSGSTELGNYKNMFEDKAYDLLDADIVVLKPIEDYPKAFKDLLLLWRNSLQRCYIKYKKYNHYNAALNDRVLFYFIHLMNNRIGFNTLDEAYISILLKKALKRVKNYEAA